MVLEISQFFTFNMATARHIGFTKFEIFSSWSGWEG